MPPEKKRDRGYAVESERRNVREPHKSGEGGAQRDGLQRQGQNVEAARRAGPCGDMESTSATTSGK